MGLWAFFFSQAVDNLILSLYRHGHFMPKYFLSLFSSFQRLANFHFPYHKQNTCVQSYFIQVFYANDTGNGVLLGYLKVEGQYCFYRSPAIGVLYSI